MLVHSSWSSIHLFLITFCMVSVRLTVCPSIRQSVSLPSWMSACSVCLSIFSTVIFNIFDILSRTTKPRPGQVLQFILYIFSALPSFKSVWKIWYKIAALTAELFPSCYEKRHSVDQTTNNETEYHELSLFILYA